jgi:hypothetical protein
VQGVEAERQRMVADLQLLNDVLASTPIAGRYWLFGGLVLGLAREGRLMDHDLDDADFAYLGEDEDLLLESFPALEEAGFTLTYRYPGATGMATEYSFARRGAKFEFFRIDVVDGSFRWFNYGTCLEGPVRNECRIPAQPLGEVSLVDRTWLGSRDEDLELTALYGDWRTPDPGFEYMDAPTIVARTPWDNSSYRVAR